MRTLLLAVTLLSVSRGARAQDAGADRSSSHRNHHSFHFPPNIHVEMDTDDDSDRDDDDDDHDDDEDRGRHRGGPGVWIRKHHGDNPSEVKASATVKGPIAFRLETFNGDIEVVPSNGNVARISVRGGNLSEVKLVPRGDDRMSAEFAGALGLATGEVRLELPKGSTVDLATLSGDIKIGGLGANARLRTTQGDIDVRDAINVEAVAVNGSVEVRNATGAVRVKTVAGDAQIISGAGPATQLDFESTSGDLSFTGACGKGCRVSAASLSGDLNLNLEDKSSFELEFRSNTGDFDDDLHINVKDSGRRRRSSGAWVHGTYGQGEGVIEAESFSGDFNLQRSNENKADGGAGRAPRHHHGVSIAPPQPPMPPIPPLPPRSRDDR